MKGDFSRVTFDSKKHYTRVLQQQGRVQLDADWNEQNAILLHYLQTLASDLIGNQGGPKDELDGTQIKRKKLGFDVIVDPKVIDNFNELTENEKESLQKNLSSPTVTGPFLIGKGRYYVDGLLAEVDDFYGFYKQPDYPWDEGKSLAEGRYLIYLDVWERHITSLEDKIIHEVALGDADTASRAKLVWQVKAENVPKDSGESATQEAESDEIIKKLQPVNRGRLKVQAKYDKGTSEPCITAPQSSYRGLENQLYRVEVYREGTDYPFKFKWSRDNASVATGAKLLGNVLSLDDPRGFSAGQWVEITSDRNELLGASGALAKIKSIEGNELNIDIKENTQHTFKQSESIKARRWDGAEIEIKESRWIALADGVSIEFQPDAKKEIINYRNGDYWLIPVRTATGDAEWPDNLAKPPFGVDHHYAPLAIIYVNSSQQASLEYDLRKSFGPVVELVSKVELAIKGARNK